MIKNLLGVILAIAMLALLGCGEQKKAAEPNLLQEISGVWKAQRGTGLITVDYTDSKIRLLFDDTPIAVNVGAIDNENKTVNFNITLAATGKPAVWTVRQIWDTDKTAFHLQLTLNDGTQDDFGFVRKISTDDLNHIASLYAPPAPDNSVQVAAQAAQPEQQAQPTADDASAVPPIIERAPAAEAAPAAQPEPQPQPMTAAASVVPPVVERVPAAAASSATEVAPVAQDTTAFAPSFDCAKASSGPERLICGTPALAALDVELAQSYKRQMGLTNDKSQLKAAEIEWRTTVRDACSASSCMEQAYRSRIDELDAVGGRQQQ
jgi:uncharacterized protein YecT (DUF1311 family)